MVCGSQLYFELSDSRPELIRSWTQAFAKKKRNEF